MSERRDGLRRTLVWLSVAVLLSPCLVYSGAYAYARLTHELVHYSGGFIARRDVMHGIGYSTEELVFAPAAIVEETVRGLVDPTW